MICAIATGEQGQAYHVLRLRIPRPELETNAQGLARKGAKFKFDGLDGQLR